MYSKNHNVFNLSGHILGTIFVFDKENNNQNQSK